jgi:DNA-binding FrmR family transcriptional regulator/protein-L-isoaspartate O-methyltransferase
MDHELTYFENYAETWDKDRKENPEKMTRILQMLSLPPDAHVLDVGCGTGILVPYLQKILTHGGTIEELDYSHKMLEKAREKFGALSCITFTEGNVLRLPLPESAYDAVLCLNFYPHIGTKGETFIKKITRTLKPGGSLIIFHDESRTHVNHMHQNTDGMESTLLPPVDVLAMLLIGAGLTIEIAFDTNDLYLIKGTKKVPDSPFDANGNTANRASLHTETKKVIHRLARISGHLEGIRRMIEEGRDCSEILIQISAVDSALISTGKVILQDHISHCLVDAVKRNDAASIENLQKAISKLIK